MSVFLESAKPVKKINISEATDSIEKTCLHFNESLAYSEIGWQNILMSAMNEEFQVITEADGSNKNKVLETVKGWFKKAIEWLKKMFAKIKELFTSIRSKVSPTFIVIKNFATKNEKAIKEGSAKAAKEGATVKINNWNTGNIPSSQQIIGAFSMNMQNFEDISAKAKSLINENGEPKEVKVTPQLAALTTKNAKEASKNIDAITKLLKLVETNAKQMNTEAQKGVNATSEEQASEQKEKVVKYKTGLIARNKAASTIISLATKALKDSHKVNTTCYRFSNKKEEAAA